MSKPFGYFQPSLDGPAGSYKWGIYTIVRDGNLWVAFGPGGCKPERVASFRTLRSAHRELTGEYPEAVKRATS